MIRPYELFVLSLEEKFKLRSHEMESLYLSLTGGQFCLYRPGRSKNTQYQKVYNSKWLFKRLTQIRAQIKIWSRDHKINILTLDHQDYPISFRRLKNPPYGLFIFGSTKNLNPGLGIVGRREAKTYTLKWMEDHIAPTLKSKKLAVISGGARGVDSKAHKIALMNNCPTVYVIPSGLLKIYPSQLQNQMQELVDLGAVFISTYHPNSEMEKQNFGDRNLLIAALSSKIIILEAQVRSGTYKTAKYALDLGCDLGVVPSFPTDQSYSGSLQLLYDGAHMLRNTEDVKSFIDGI